MPKISQPPQPSLAKWLPLTSQYIEGKAVQTVNARELHSFLKVGRDFSNWIKDRIAEYGFVEGGDYLVFTKFGENPQGGRPQKEYAIRLDMGKELAMVERNDEGRRARRYFIDCEALLIAVAPELYRVPMRLAVLRVLFQRLMKAQRPHHHNATGGCNE
ncbi:antA/AntB antirepressor family protein [Aeromonas caviae]|uniref:antA/AntB antirepressor family protein n=1 Tax=Aeromonas caviae TaxID=648 RepID=UPI001CC7D5C7|nr:antA/AntB antirepressor family protein [Aeromonas caviae]